MMHAFRNLAKEPPFRLLVRSVLRRFRMPARAQARWELVPRPHYLLGLAAAADRAVKEKISEFTAIEFGVAGGNGLLELERYARLVAEETSLTIHVCGFDTSTGIPTSCGDYRDHPDIWVPGDYPMACDSLQDRLSEDTELVLGDVRETVINFVAKRQRSPIGFAAFDLDLYSSTRDALQLLAHKNKRMLRRTFLYFDDVVGAHYHQFAGELLAIREFNDENASVKIDRWRGIEQELVFPESAWVQKMYVAHDVERISSFQLNRQPNRTKLQLASHT